MEESLDLTTLAILKIIATVVVAIGGVFKGMRFVHEGERGIKLRFGRALRDTSGKPLIIEPGFVWLIPFVDTLKRRHVRQQTRHFSYQRIKLKDGLIYIVEAVILFKVADIYTALFEVDDLDSTLDDIGMTIVRDEIGNRTHGELEDDTGISTRLMAQMNPFAKKLGIEVIRFSLTDCAPTAETAHLLNTELAAKLRLQALKTISLQAGRDWNAINPGIVAALIGIPVAATVGTGHELTSQAVAPLDGSDEN